MRNLAPAHSAYMRGNAGGRRYDRVSFASFSKKIRIRVRPPRRVASRLLGICAFAMSGHAMFCVHADSIRSKKDGLNYVRCFCQEIVIAWLHLPFTIQSILFSRAGKGRPKSGQNY
jgi:hypothetical protein